MAEQLHHDSHRRPPCSVSGCDRPIYSLGKRLCRNCYERLRTRGTTARAAAPHGSGTVMSHGYRRLGVQGEKVLEHRLIAECAMGKPLPASAVVHHVDGDKANNAPGNLVVCPSESYHRLLHRRQEARAACGHPDWIRCRFCRRYSPPSAIVMRSGDNFHPQCRRERIRFWTSLRRLG